jgi:hypothetical protein
MVASKITVLSARRLLLFQQQPIVGRNENMFIEDDAGVKSAHRPISFETSGVSVTVH